MANESQADFFGSRGNDSSPETIVIVNCVLNGPMMLISIIGNTLVLAAILRTPSLRSPSMIFLCSLAVSDLLVGLVVQPIYIATNLTRDSSLDEAMKRMAIALCGVSLLTMTAISVDRFLALHYHMRYPNVMTTKRASYASATLWFINLLSFFLTFWSMKVYYFAIAISIVIFLLISTVCYVVIYRIVRRHQLQIRLQHQAVEIHDENIDSTTLQSTKNVKNTFIYFIVMILCYSPVVISLSILVISPHHWTNEWTFAETVAFMNSSINPILYCWRLGELRTAVLKTAKQMLCKRTENN
ncbi:melanocyte-stimulating hormone receptor-like [Oculina patagonica]